MMRGAKGQLATLLITILVAACSGSSTATRAPATVGIRLPTSITPAIDATARSAVSPPSSTMVQATGTVQPDPVALPRTIAAAEAEARTYPRADPDGTTAASFSAVPGSPARTCVDVGPFLASTADQNLPTPGGTGGAAGIRSGEFVAGPFGNFVAQESRARQEDKLWWVPLHRRAMPGLTVRAVPLDEPADGQIFTVNLVAWNADGQFYPSGIALPQAGRWMLIATSGPDWGCFVLRLKT
jgi:hypothetical protein